MTLELQAEHGEVVVGLGAIAMLLDGGGKTVDDLTGILEAGGSKYL